MLLRCINCIYISQHAPKQGIFFFSERFFSLTPRNMRSIVQLFATALTCYFSKNCIKIYLKVNSMTFHSFFNTSFLIYHRRLNSPYLLRQQFSYNKSKKVQNFINLLIQPHRWRMIDIFETSWSKQWPNSKIFHFMFAMSRFHSSFCYILIHWHNQNSVQSHR